MTPRRREEVVEADVDTEARADPRGSEPRGSAAAPESESRDRLVELEALLVEAEARRDEYLELLQRVQADFENYRKRAAREQERLVAHAHERLVRELLPVLDDLERAAKPPIRDTEVDRGNRVQVPPTEEDRPDLRAQLDAVVDGVKLVEQSLRKALEKEGLVEIETDGTFDPHVHDALLTQPSEQAESGSVLEVVQRGYRLGDRVVRPARVIVAE